MKSSLLALTAGLATLTHAATASNPTALPSSTDASAFLSDIQATPTWATGQYATSLATALYAVETSFYGRDDYTSIRDAIWSAASKDGGSEVLASMSTSYWDWGSITADAWYTKNVPAALQTEVLGFDSALGSAYNAVETKATATGNGAGPRCTGMAVAGVAAAVGVAVVGVM